MTDDDLRRAIRDHAASGEPPPGFVETVVDQLSDRSPRGRPPLVAWLAGAVAVAVLAVGVAAMAGRLPAVGPVTTPSPSETATASPSGQLSVVWHEEDWPAYSYVVESMCGFQTHFGRFRIEVRDEAVVGVRRLDGPTSAPGADDAKSFRTMSDLLDLAAEARASGADRVDLVTDPLDGHVVSLDIDWVEAAIDDEQCYHVEDVVRIAVWSPEEWSGYSYDLRSTCGERSLIGRFRIHVRNEAVVAAEGLDDQGRRSVDMLPLDAFPTISDLLDMAADARASGADVVNLVTDPEEGHPVSLEIDWVVEAIDDEACYVVEELTPEP